MHLQIYDCVTDVYSCKTGWLNLLSLIEKEYGYEQPISIQICNYVVGGYTNLQFEYVTCNYVVGGYTNLQFKYVTM